MSRKGMPYDNAVMESFFSSLKLKLTHHEQFNDREEARSKVFDYIEVFTTGSGCIGPWTTALPRCSRR